MVCLCGCVCRHISITLIIFSFSLASSYLSCDFKNTKHRGRCPRSDGCRRTRNSNLEQRRDTFASKFRESRSWFVFIDIVFFFVGFAHRTPYIDNRKMLYRNERRGSQKKETSRKKRNGKLRSITVATIKDQDDRSSRQIRSKKLTIIATTRFIVSC